MLTSDGLKRYLASLNSFYHNHKNNNIIELVKNKLNLLIS